MILPLMLLLAGCASVQPPSTDGMYYGYLPCDDCEGISYQLQLEENSTYVLKTKKEGTKDIVSYRGTYTISPEGTMLLIGQTGPVKLNRLKVSGDTLLADNQAGAQLSKVKPEGYNMSLRVSSAQPEFTAHGNEPFWKLKIQGDQITFSALAETKIDYTAQALNTTDEGNKITYTSKSDHGRLKAVVQLDTCTDGMSGEPFYSTVEVYYSNSDTSQPATYKGCGAYSGDYRLNDIWALTHIDNKKITPKNAPPTLELQLKEGRLHGSDGCNHLSANFYFFNKNIITSNLTATRKSCKDHNLEDEYRVILSGNKLRYALQPGILKLRANGRSLQFKKVD